VPNRIIDEQTEAVKTNSNTLESPTRSVNLNPSEQGSIRSQQPAKITTMQKVKMLLKNKVYTFMTLSLSALYFIITGI
jgi:hypothetical protein